MSKRRIRKVRHVSIIASSDEAKARAVVVDRWQRRIKRQALVTLLALPPGER